LPNRPHGTSCDGKSHGEHWRSKLTQFASARSRNDLQGPEKHPRVPPGCAAGDGANIRRESATWFYSAEVISESMKLADIVKLNHEELLRVMEILGLGRGDEESSPRSHVGGRYFKARATAKASTRAKWRALRNPRIGAPLKCLTLPTLLETRFIANYATSAARLGEGEQFLHLDSRSSWAQLESKQQLSTP
jgi:hypothetical protein